MLTLYSAPTPNGYKVSCLLEELEFDYQLVSVNIYAGEHNSPSFVALNPHRRIPVVVDDGVCLSESSAIMQYLAEKGGRLLPRSGVKRAIVIQWLVFQAVNVSDSFGRLTLLARYRPQGNRQEIAALRKECHALVSLLEQQLKNRQYLVDDYSIADIATWCWLRVSPWIGLVLDEYPATCAWIERIAARPACQRGIQKPTLAKDLFAHVRDVQRLLAEPHTD